jgi:hypothetical protein
MKRLIAILLVATLSGIAVAKPKQDPQPTPVVQVQKHPLRKFKIILVVAVGAAIGGMLIYKHRPMGNQACCNMWQ